MGSKTIVEGMLPARHLVDLAVYIQTCAHIENACWRLFRLLDPTANQRSNVAFAASIKVKLSTRKLLQSFKRASEHVHPREAIWIHCVHSRMLDGLENRNLAAHGAFFFATESDTLNVEHYFNRKSDPKGVYRFISEPIEQDDINEAIEDADQILRELIDIRKQVVGRRKQLATSQAGSLRRAPR